MLDYQAMATPELMPIAPEIWGAEHDLFMNGVVHFRGRMTVVRLRSGGLLLHSVNPIDDTLAATLAELGPVEHLVAPNNLHYVHLADAMSRYPKAKTWGGASLAEKCPHLRFDAVLGRDTPAWADELTPLSIEGVPWASETVFFHKATATLLVTDLVFNIHEVKGWISPWVFRMAGAYKKFAQSRLLRSSTKDRGAAGASVRTMLEWPFERIVMAHGEVIEDDAHARTEAALWWMRGAKAIAPPRVSTPA